MKQPARGRAPKKHVILFLAANPLNTDRVALEHEREARAIQLELKRSGYRDSPGSPRRRARAPGSAASGAVPEFMMAGDQVDAALAAPSGRAQARRRPGD